MTIDPIAAIIIIIMCSSRIRQEPYDESVSVFRSWASVQPRTSQGFYEGTIRAAKRVLSEGSFSGTPPYRTLKGTLKNKQYVLQDTIRDTIRQKGHKGSI